MARTTPDLGLPAKLSQMTSEEFDPEQATRISAAIVKAIAEAKVLVDAESLGPELHDVVQHARELHDLLREQVESGAPPRLR